jgi:hypothetical protein
LDASALRLFITLKKRQATSVKILRPAAEFPNTGFAQQIISASQMQRGLGTRPRCIWLSFAEHNRSERTVDPSAIEMRIRSEAQTHVQECNISAAWRYQNTAD